MDVGFEAIAPWTVLFGPSGSGKSTILRVIAGLERPDEGFVRIGGTTVLEIGRGVDVATHKRPIRWSAQRAMLMPRKSARWSLVEGMSVRDPQFEGRSWIDVVERAIEHFKLGEIKGKLPHELSGGQRQRVAVVRAAVGAVGKVLLLDEPFNGLDAAVRDELIADLRSWLGDTPVVSVTHDVGEVFLLGADVVKIADGRVVSQGSVSDVLADERLRLQASLAIPQSRTLAGI
jgi:molybdate transport system ATP-binding protein